MNDFYDNLDYYMQSNPNMFAGGGNKQQGGKQNYVQRSRSQFLQEYADVNKIKERTRQAIESTRPKRGRLQKNMSNKEFVKKTTDSFVKSAPKMSTAEAKERQRWLKSMGLYTGKIDGKWGSKSTAANDAALAAGYRWDNGSYQVDRSSFEPGITDRIKKVWNKYSMMNPVTRFLFDQPYYGSEEDARKLGYKTFVDDNGYEHTVDYGSAMAMNGNLSTRDRAAQQMEMFGITDEMTSNKSGLDRFLYENLPSYSYDVMQTLSNALNGTKQADAMTGRSVIMPEREGTMNEAERNATPFRESLRNLAFHYPDPNRRLKVSPYEKPGQGEFDLGYAFYDPEVQNYILNDPIYQQTTPGGTPVQAGIVSNYYDPVAVYKFSRKQQKGETMKDEKGREFYLNDDNQRVYKSGPAISTVQNPGEQGPLGDYGYGAWSASKDAQGRRVAYDKWDLQLGPFNIPGFELYYKGSN